MEFIIWIVIIGLAITVARRLISRGRDSGGTSGREQPPTDQR